MKVVYAIKYETGRDLRDRALKLSHSWLKAVAKIREIGNKGCVVNDHEFDIILYTSDELSFVMQYTVNSLQHDVFMLQMGDANYTLEVDRTQKDHFADSLEVRGPSSLLTVGDETWSKTVLRCLDRILFYAPSD
jgi:hypothetical protein